MQNLSRVFGWQSQHIANKENTSLISSMEMCNILLHVFHIGIKSIVSVYAEEEESSESNKKCSSNGE